MLKTIAPNRRYIIMFFCFPTNLLVSLIASVITINAFYLSADSPLDDVEPLIKSSNVAIEKIKTPTDKISKIKIELEKAKEFKKANDASIKALNDLDDFLDKNADSTLKSITDLATELNDQDKKIDILTGKLKALPTAPDIEAAIKKLDAQKKEIGKKITELTAAKDSLAEPVNNVFKSADNLVSDLTAQINTINDQNENVDSLLKSLPDQLPKLVLVYNLRTSMKETWTPLQIQLKKFVSAPAVDLSDKLTKAETAISAILKKVGNWLNILTAEVNTTSKILIDTRIKLDEDLQPNAVPAIKLLDGTEEKEKIINIIAILAKEVAEKTKTESIAVAVAILDEELKKLKARNGLVREGLAGDFNNFVNDFVPLYYFTDVFNLMHVINPETREIRDISALREEAAAARRKVDRADFDLAEAQAAVSSLQVRKRNLQNELKDAENDFTSSSGLLAQATRRLSRFDENDPKRRAFKERADELTEKKNADETRYNALKDETNGLPAQIKAADTALLAAQTAARKARSSLVTLAQDESVAFAKARDNEPVFFAPNDVTSKDPLKQIIIYAFGNRKILYLRGTKENVNKAKSIISFFDRPAPQARLSLWTLELNGQATKQGSENFNESLEIVDKQLSNTRTQIAVTLAVLRKCINEKVFAVANTKLSNTEGKLNQNTLNGDNADLLRWARSFFYQDEVLLRLGFDPTKPLGDQQDEAKIVARYALPDPIGAGTLGESLVILALAKPEYRDEILTNFTNQIQVEFETASNSLKSEKIKDQSTPSLKGKDPFILTKKMLDFGSTSPYTPIQKEIVNSITLASVPRLFKRLDQLGNFKPTSKISPEAREIANLKKEIKNVLDFLWTAYKISTTDLFGYDVRPEKGSDLIVSDLLDQNSGEKLITKLVRNLRIIKQNQNVFRLANAQIAKTDNMVKQLIDAFDEDVNRTIIQPTIYDLRRNLVKKKIGVGIIDRTTVLATNRLIARVDARGSAQLTVGEEQDALLAAQQLANLYLAAKTGGLLGGLNGLKSIQQQRETSEVYGINSGSVFKVTPVFDPNGQALRFQFDHTQANLVTEPDGSIQPSLPRIERHTVNTEVQLNNLELREISRFESNAKLGIPTTYKGGVPIFRDIPYVNKVPLLGWFVRRSGKAAVIQESLVLGQTTMYPTIADIFDLLSGDDYNLDSIESNDYTASPKPIQEATPTVNPSP